MANEKNGKYLSWRYIAVTLISIGTIIFFGWTASIQGSVSELSKEIEGLKIESAVQKEIMKRLERKIDEIYRVIVEEK